MIKSQITKKDLRITVEKQVWESTLNHSMVLEAENYRLKELLKECRSALVRFVSYDDSEENARILLMNKINEVFK